jgi:hypothetical protein
MYKANPSLNSSGTGVDNVLESQLWAVGRVLSPQVELGTLELGRDGKGKMNA